MHGERIYGPDSDYSHLPALTLISDVETYSTQPTKGNSMSE